MICIRENKKEKSMDGLIIKHKWLDLILKGKKTIEVRGSDTKNRVK